jgi:hypothetical protein
MEIDELKIKQRIVVLDADIQKVSIQIQELEKQKQDAIALMKVTSLLFFGIVSIPIILFISLMESILIA